MHKTVGRVFCGESERRLAAPVALVKLHCGPERETRYKHDHSTVPAIPVCLLPDQSGPKDRCSRRRLHSVDICTS